MCKRFLTFLFAIVVCVVSNAQEEKIVKNQIGVEFGTQLPYLRYKEVEKFNPSFDVSYNRVIWRKLLIGAEYQFAKYSYGEESPFPCYQSPSLLTLSNMVLINFEYQNSYFLFCPQILITPYFQFGYNWSRFDWQLSGIPENNNFEKVKAQSLVSVFGVSVGYAFCESFMAQLSFACAVNCSDSPHVSSYPKTYLKMKEGAVREAKSVMDINQKSVKLGVRYCF